MAEELENLIHSPVRLRVLAYLASVGQSDFQVLREVADVPTADLSRQLRLLREAGLVGTLKLGGRRRGTAVYLTVKGETDFRRYRKALARTLDPEGT